MTAPLPRRLRVVVMGNSTAMYVRPRRRVREDGAYSHVLESRLRERGIDAWVVNEGRWYELIPQAFRRWQEAVHANSPDVVVLNYGLADCQPRMVPTWAFRIVFTWRPRLDPVSTALRRSLPYRGLQRALVYAMPRFSSRLPMRTWRVSPSRFESELRRFLLLTRIETGALVLVLTPNPPGPLLQRLMPDIDRRAARYDTIIRDVVAGLDDPGVRIIEAGAVVEKFGWRKAMVDGLHYTALGHREVATLIEEEIDASFEASREVTVRDRPAPAWPARPEGI